MVDLTLHWKNCEHFFLLRVDVELLFSNIFYLQYTYTNLFISIKQYLRTCYVFCGLFYFLKSVYLFDYRIPIKLINHKELLQQYIHLAVICGNSKIVYKKKGKLNPTHKFFSFQIFIIKTFDTMSFFNY